MSDQTISPYVLNDITQIVTAIGVILTAISSILNRIKLSSVDQKVEKAVTVAAHANVVAEQKAEEIKTAVLEVKDAAVAVNAEVVQQVHDSGVEAGKAIANGGH